MKNQIQWTHKKFNWEKKFFLYLSSVISGSFLFSKDTLSRSTHKVKSLSKVPFQSQIMCLYFTDMKVDKIIALIKERVGGNYELPGWKSHRKMSVIPINSITEKAFIPPKRC